jgi:hypothetical protein
MLVFNKTTKNSKKMNNHSNEVIGFWFHPQLFQDSEELAHQRFLPIKMFL